MDTSSAGAACPNQVSKKTVDREIRLGCLWSRVLAPHRMAPRTFARGPSVASRQRMGEPEHATA